MELEKNPVTRKVFLRILRLGDQILGKPFPRMRRVRQISVYACGPATLEMLFSFVGVKVSQTGIIRSLRAQKRIRAWGLIVKELAKAARIYGDGDFIFWKKQFATLGDLSTIVNKYKWPVGVEWQGVFYENDDEDNGHYGVVTKIDKKAGYLRIADPYFNGTFKYGDVDRRFGIKEFLKKWWDINQVKFSGSSKIRNVKDTRMMFIITPKGTSWPRRLGMKKAL